MGTTKLNELKKQYEFVCNDVRVHQSLRVTPAMESGLVDRPLEIGFLIGLTENVGIKKY